MIFALVPHKYSVFLIWFAQLRAPGARAERETLPFSAGYGTCTVAERGNSEWRVIICDVVRQRCDIAPTSLRHRCDSAATSLRHRAPTSLRQTRDPLAKSLRRRRDGMYSAIRLVHWKSACVRESPAQFFFGRRRTEKHG